MRGNDPNLRDRVPPQPASVSARRFRIGDNGYPERPYRSPAPAPPTDCEVARQTPWVRLRYRPARYSWTTLVRPPPRTTVGDGNPGTCLLRECTGPQTSNRWRPASRRTIQTAACPFEKPLIWFSVRSPAATMRR